MPQEVTIKYKASPDPAIRAAQQTLVESWAYVSAYYVDHDFNGTDWKQLAQVSPHPGQGSSQTQRIAVQGLLVHPCAIRPVAGVKACNVFKVMLCVLTQAAC